MAYRHEATGETLRLGEEEKEILRDIANSLEAIHVSLQEIWAKMG